MVVTCHAAQFFPRLKRGTARTNTKVADDGNSDLPPSKKTKCEKSVPRPPADQAVAATVIKKCDKSVE